MNLPIPPALDAELLENYLATNPEPALLDGAKAFAQYISEQLKADPVTSTRVDRFGLCLVRRSGKMLRLVSLAIPAPGPAPVPVRGEMGVNLMEVYGAQSVRAQ